MTTATELDVIHALINGVHWGQVLLHERVKPETRSPLFELNGVALETVQARAAAFDVLLKELAGNRAWRKSELRADLRKLVAELKAAPLPVDPSLPFHVAYNVIAQNLAPEKVPAALALANLYQLNMEEHRDGDGLQDLFQVYINAGFPVDLLQFGLPNSDEHLQLYSNRCAAACAPAPFKTDAFAWLVTFNRIEMWGEKNTGRRDKFVLARELLADPEILPLIPKLSELPHQRVAFIGYSMMMSVNWSTYAAWNDIASEALRCLNPRYEYAGFQMGGITASHALQALIPQALEYKPTDAYLLMRVETEPDAAAFETLIRVLQRIGTKVHVIDDVRPYVKPLPEHEHANRRRAAERTGADLVRFLELGLAHAEFRSWECLDRIHMRTPGHVFYARELLKRLAREN